MERDPPVTTPTMYIIVVTVRVLYQIHTMDPPPKTPTLTTAPLRPLIIVHPEVEAAKSSHRPASISRRGQQPTASAAPGGRHGGI